MEEELNSIKEKNQNQQEGHSKSYKRVDLHLNEIEEIDPRLEDSNC